MSATPQRRLIGRHILRLDCVDSTNTVAASHADDPGREGLVVLAEEQTAGRGREGRRWLSPRGAGLLLSVLLFPPTALRRPAILTLWAAVAVCETIFASIARQATIKWPNDVLLAGRKVAGILIEQGRGTVVGIGLNVNTPAELFAQAGLTEAGSLRMFAERELVREEVCQALLDHLDMSWAELLAGNFADLEARWRFHSALLGRSVQVETGAGRLAGRLLELSLAGVRLQLPTGAEMVLEPEMIAHMEE